MSTICTTRGSVPELRKVTVAGGNGRFGIKLRLTSRGVKASDGTAYPVDHAVPLQFAHNSLPSGSMVKNVPTAAANAIGGSGKKSGAYKVIDPTSERVMDPDVPGATRTDC